MNLESSGDSLTQNNSFYEMWSLNSSERRSSKVEKTHRNLKHKIQGSHYTRLSQATFWIKINSIVGRIDKSVCMYCWLPEFIGETENKNFLFWNSLRKIPRQRRRPLVACERLECKHCSRGKIKFIKTEKRSLYSAYYLNSHFPPLVGILCQLL